jgi:hypothetical protein
LFKSEIEMSSFAANLEAKYDGEYGKIMSQQGPDQNATPK